MLAVRNPRRIDGELFNAESMGGGRIVKWNNMGAARMRAAQLRRRGFQVRVIPTGDRGPDGGRRAVVYVGDVRADVRGTPNEPRAQYDWAGAGAADTRI